MSTTTAAAPARQRQPRPKPERRIRLCVKPVDGAFGIVRIRVGKETTDYFVTELAADFGRGFKVEKVPEDLLGEPTVFHVNLDAGRKTCDCKGFCRWSHCKHSDGLAALITANLL